MFKFVRAILVLVGVLVLLLSGIMAISRHKSTPPSWIIYRSDYILYRMYPNGTGKQQISASDPTCNGLPQVSPDAQWILVVCWREAQQEVYEIRTDGSDQRRLLRVPLSYHVQDFQWLPDGEWILYTLASALTRDLYRMRPNGTDQQQLTVNLSISGSAALSPDGQWVVFAGSGGLYRMRSDGTELYLVRSSGYSPQWSPDGEWILFQANLPDTRRSINRIRSDGIDEQIVIVFDTIGYGPQYSPNGEWILFTAYNDGTIYKIRTDGTNLRALTTRAIDSNGRAKRTNASPQWSPDGEWILFRSVNPDNSVEIRRMYSDGTNEQILVEAGNNTDPVYSPPIQSDWHPWRSIAAGIGLISLAICPWHKLMRKISHDQIHTRDSSVVR
jgi:Tol biopolymer transport system component